MLVVACCRSLRTVASELLALLGRNAAFGKPGKHRVPQRLRRGSFDTCVIANTVPTRFDACSLALEVGRPAGGAVLLGDRHLVFNKLALNPFDPRPHCLGHWNDGAALSRMHPTRL